MGPPDGLFTELSKWKAKAAKRGKLCTFTSDIIPSWLDAEVKAAMDVVGVGDAFLFLRAKAEMLTTAERRLQRGVAEILDDFSDTALQAVLAGTEPDYAPLEAALAALFIPFLTSVAVQETLRVSVDVGIAFDPAVINTHAIEWARTYSYELIKGLTDTTRKVVSETIVSFFETPGMTQGDIEKLLEPAFGQVRAKLIGTTEATRAASEGTNEMQRLVSETGYPMIRIWDTAGDDLVCEICGPLNGQPESVWAAQYPSGPPDPHPGCRCGIGLSALDDKFHLTEAVEFGKQRVTMFEEMDDKPGAQLAREELAKMRERLRNA